MKDYIVIFKDDKDESQLIRGVDSVESIDDGYEFYSDGVCIAIIPKKLVFNIKTTDIEEPHDKKVNISVTFKYQNQGSLLYDIFKNTVDAKCINGIYTIYDEHGVLATIPMESIVYIKRLTNN